MFLAKDFIETAEGLVFAVVESGLEQEKVLCFLRYIYLDHTFQKVNTEKANEFLKKNYPQYLYFSPIKQANLHAISTHKVFKHHQPRNRLKKLLEHKARNNVENDLVTLCKLFEKLGLKLSDVGVTGSILISAQNQHSDIDLVFYTSAVFHKARQITRQLITQGDCSALTAHDWQASYDRRQCDLSYSEYLWHEKRKFNKAMIHERKFDLSFVSKMPPDSRVIEYKKLKPVVLKVKIIDDSRSYHYPAEFLINDRQISSIVSYTATYTGQALKGEWVEVSGILEAASDGTMRVVVGSNREAKGEFIKVLNETA